tara:strand:- start:187 stop:819 length:633 start_codon:yes stop_codon:yes gene_type:complete
VSVNFFFKDIYRIPKAPRLSIYKFENIIDLPKDIHVHDFTIKDNFQNIEDSFSIGKYNEKRSNMYRGELFEKQNRCIHMGIDIGAKAGTNVQSFYEGEIFLFKNNNRELDYGYTIITKHTFNETNLYALYGHLSKSSISKKKIGQKIHSGEVIATIGNTAENGGWPPHVHFQLSLIEPKSCDLPGVVSEKDHEIALKIFPDPRIVLGNLY